MMKESPSVCVIGIYFGKLPNYFDLWLRSASENPTIDFLIFTDNEDRELPPNVRFAPMSYEEIIRRAQKTIGITIPLKRPYKFCDLKVVYGTLFADYIAEYDYWGHCDFDLIWGDLRSFFEQYKLESYDKFLSLGHLSVYRNTKENNARFMLDGSECGDYKTVYSSEQNFAFDEEDGIYKIFAKHGFSMFEKRIFADISNIYRRFRLARNDKNFDKQVFFWRNGKVYRAFFENGKVEEEEFLYIHFQKRGKLPYTDECLRCSSFFVTYNGFYCNENQTPTLDDIEKYNQFKGVRYEKGELVKYKVHSFVRRAKNKVRRMIGI